MQVPARAARDLSIIQEAESWKVDSSLPPTSHHLSPSESARSSDDDHFLQSADLLNLVRLSSALFERPLRTGTCRETRSFYSSTITKICEPTLDRSFEKVS